MVTVASRYFDGGIPVASMSENCCWPSPPSSPLTVKKKGVPPLSAKKESRRKYRIYTFKTSSSSSSLTSNGIRQLLLRKWKEKYRNFEGFFFTDASEEGNYSTDFFGWKKKFPSIRIFCLEGPFFLSLVAPETHFISLKKKGPPI